MSLLDTAFKLAWPVLQGLDAEAAHRATVCALKYLPPVPVPKSDPLLAQRIFGLEFPNPLGLAAGFDKNAEIPDAVLRLGFGFAEVGTVTPLPQAGNAKPRLFRLGEDLGVINRMGFNNEGHWEAHKRLKARKPSGIVGVNIGANKDSVDRASDYVAGIAAFSDVADYITINISSPNTPGLRGLQSATELESLLQKLNAARGTQARRPPLLLKIAPDLENGEMADIAGCCAGGAVDGVIVSNTTLSRPGLSSVHAGEAGGLSGRPLFALSTKMLATFYQHSKGQIPLIGAGGIEDGPTALAKIHAGASLLQVYSALVYRGPGLVQNVLTALKNAISPGQTLADLRGSRAAEISYQTDAAR